MQREIGLIKCHMPRELERYGSSSYELSETIFQTDSELVLEYIDLKNFFENDATSLLFSFHGIDQFLMLFELTKDEKLKLLDRLQLSFKNEFQADKILKKELDKQYRSLENELEPFLTFQQTENFAPIYEVVKQKSDKINPIISSLKSNLDVDLFSFLGSHIHMMLNRQFTSRQREYELVIYDHLYRYYKMHVYRK